MLDDHEVYNNFDLVGAAETGALEHALTAWDRYTGAANPRWKAGVRYYVHRYGNVEWFVLDTRLHRRAAVATAGRNVSASLLGEQQTADLKQWLLTSNATIKVRFCVERNCPHMD